MSEGGKDKQPAEAKGSIPQLLFGAGGIYTCFLIYGSLQEDLYRFRTSDGVKFSFVWLMQVFEAAANVLVGMVGLAVTGATRGMPHDMFAMTGATQVISKYGTHAALANGLSFPVATLAKSAKMLPVMAGSLFLGGAVYTLRDYAQVLAIVAGTAIVGLYSGKKKGVESSSAIGLAMIVMSLVCDGLTGGVQKRLKAKTSEKGIKVKSYDFMFWTNLYMLFVALAFAFLMGEVWSGVSFLWQNPVVFWITLKVAFASAFGQSFIFFTIATFDPLVCSTVTTTRKVFSVLYSILFKGNSLSVEGWGGVVLASAGILADLQGMSGGTKGEKKPPAKAEEAEPQKC